MQKSFLLSLIAVLVVISMTIVPIVSAAGVDEAAVAVEDPIVLQDSVQFSEFGNTANGTTIKWQAFPGAARYELFLEQDGEWQKLTSTDKLSFTHEPLIDGTTYRYNIRALDADQQYVSAFQNDGYDNLYLAPPVITSLTCTDEGVVIVWGEKNGAERFRVYRKTGSSGWSRIGETDETTFVDSSAVSGKKYTYTIRCISADSSRFTSFHNSGKEITYVTVPMISSISNTATGAKLSWNKPAGADKVRAYYKDGEKWIRFAETDANSCVHNNLEPGKKYTYTIRCITNGKFSSEYNRDGWENTFIAPPVISSLESNDDGVQITWNMPAGAVRCRVYVNSDNGWKKIAETNDNTYLDTNVTSGKTYTYTVRCVSEDGSRFTSSYNSGKSIRHIGIPVISSITNTATGARISWVKPIDSARMRVYFKDGNSWKKFAETTAASVVHENLTPGQEYTYTIRCVDDKGKFLTNYNHEGWTNTFIDPPVITSLTGNEEGIRIAWNRPDGSKYFRVYFRGSNGWTRLVDTADNNYLVKNVTSGNSYTFTVRCIDPESKDFTSYYTSGKTIKYIIPPTITSFANTDTGTRVTWTKMTGAAKYRLYYKDAGNWKKITETADNSALHDALTDGTAYTYTVRCLDSKGNFISDYNRDGWVNTFIAPPVVTSVTAVEDGNQVVWSGNANAAGYRVYRKPFAGSWSRLNDSTADTTYIDTTAEADKLYAYTVRCLDENGDTISGYLDNNVFYRNGQPANGTISVDGKSYYFENGKLRSGYMTVDGKTYYYDGAGNMVKNAIVGTAETGYCYAGSNGVIDYGYCNGITYNGANWNVINGKATKVSTESDKTLFKALKVVAKVTNSSMTKEQKLKKLFDYIKVSYTEKNPRIPHYHGDGWPILYANDIFDNGVGNCFSYGSAFGYMAVGIGYTNVYACNSGGHGWAEIDGKVYDPEWSRHHSTYTYFGMTYTEPCDVKYRAGISAGYSWMHVKIH